MLEVDPKKRATSPYVASMLDSLRRKCENDPEYTKTESTAGKPLWATGIPKSMDFDDAIARNHTISVNMARLPTSYSGNNTAPAAIQPHTTPASLHLSHGSRSQTSAANSISPSLFEPSLTVPSSQQGLHESTNPPQVSFQQVVGFRNRNRVTPTPTNKRKIGNELEQENLQKLGRAKIRKLDDFASSKTLKARHNNPESAYGQHDEPGGSSNLPAANDISEMLFACPYYQRDPAKYGTREWKSCIGPGWTIPRLKSVLTSFVNQSVFSRLTTHREHIYRRHCSKTYRCDRCFAEFERVDQYTTHIRSEIPCFKETNSQRPDTIYESQKAQIQKKSPKKPGWDKWNDIYRIIFPFDPPEAIPSPCTNRHSTLRCDANIEG